MKIVIADDRSEERASLRTQVNQYFDLRKKRYSVSPEYVEFESGENFINNFYPGIYTLVFLDIYMKEMNGMDVARKIVSLDKSLNIIFFTTSDEFQLDGYGVHAVGYLMKPVSKNLKALYTALDFVMDKQKPDISDFIVQSEYGEIPIYYRDLIYLDSIDRNLYLHLPLRTIKISGRYSDYQTNLLSDSRFLECYRSVIVNMDYIETPLDSDFILKTGEKVPISRRKKSEVMDCYTTYFISNRKY